MMPRRKRGIREFARLGHRLLALGVSASLLAQLALPALHALKTEAAEHRAPITRLAAADASSGLAIVDASTRAHDPSKCPVCRSLLRTSPLATPRAVCEPLAAEVIAASPAAPVFSDSIVAQVGHPPRAPPRIAIHLV